MRERRQEDLIDRPAFFAQMFFLPERFPFFAGMAARLCLNCGGGVQAPFDVLRPELSCALKREGCGRECVNITRWKGQTMKFAFEIPKERC
jgi:hypothetical protein